jgi:hypothetical protein
MCSTLSFILSIYFLNFLQIFCKDIQEFYEAVLLDDNKDADSKALAVLRIADKWLENAPLPAAINVSMNKR